MTPRERVRVAEHVVAMRGPREIEGVCSEFLTGFVNVGGAFFLAPFVALIVLHSCKEAFEVSRLVPRVQISNRIFGER